LFDRASSMWVK